MCHQEEVTKRTTVTSSRLQWRGLGRESGGSRSRPLRGCGKTSNPWLLRLWSCTLWSGRRAAPPSLWWGRTLLTCRRRSEGSEGGWRSRLISPWSPFLVWELDPVWIEERGNPDSEEVGPRIDVFKPSARAGRKVEIEE